MPENIITPLQLWQGFNPVKDPLEVSFVLSESLPEGAYRYGVYFSAFTADDGKVRAYADIYYSPRNAGNPTLIYIPDYYSLGIDRSILDTALANGYNIVIADYSGETGEKSHYTKYPKSLDYLNILRSGRRLRFAEPSARETCVFGWSKIIRRTLTLIDSVDFLSSEIALIGIKEGANMMWQVGGMDARMRTLIPIINAGWNVDVGDFAEGGDIDDERERWITACTAEEYAQFVTCPLLFLGASNSTLTSIDRVNDTLNFIDKSVERSRTIAADCSNQIQRAGLRTLERWLDHIFRGSRFPKQPELSYQVSEGRLTVEIVSDASSIITEVVLNYAYGKTDSEFRFWNKKVLSADFSGNSFGEITVFDKDEPIIAFANVYYKGGEAVSSRIYTIDVSQSQVNEEKYREERILFERKNGVHHFVIENDDFFSDKSNLVMTAGPRDIQGVTALDGRLSTYIIGDKRYKSKDGMILRIDMYSKEKRDVDVVIYTEKDSEKAENSYTVTLGGNEEWQKVALSANDFKNSERISLRDWRNIKKLTFKNSTGLLISNMVWV